MKLISLNTWGGKVFEPLINFIKQHSRDTDIFCFQEVFNTTSNFTEHSGFRLNLYKEIAKSLTDHQGYFAPCIDNYIAGSFQPNFIDFNLSWGLAIFINKKIVVSSNSDFFVYGKRGSFNPKDENSVPRNLQYIYFKIDNNEFTVGNLHGIWIRGPKIDNPPRIQQSEMIKDFLNHQTGKKILVGDFNLDINTQSIRILESNMRNLIKEYTISTTRSNLYDMSKIDKFADYTFVSSDVAVLDFKLPEVSVSDHLPMILEFN